jgi:hypothetical protein
MGVWPFHQSAAFKGGRRWAKVGEGGRRWAKVGPQGLIPSSPRPRSGSVSGSWDASAPSADQDSLRGRFGMASFSCSLSRRRLLNIKVNASILASIRVGRTSRQLTSPPFPLSAAIGSRLSLLRGVCVGGGVEEEKEARQ